MDSNRLNERVFVVAGEDGLSVTVTLGEVQVVVTLPATPDMRDLGVEQIRALALRHARRALQVAQEELE